MASSWLPHGKGLLNAPIDKGMHVTKPELKPDEGGLPRNRANAALEGYDGSRIFLWVNEVEMDYGMGGTTGQSMLVRDWYSHNFIQPVFRISGQCPNQFEHQRLAEFIRWSHVTAINPKIKDGQVKLWLFSKGKNTKRPIERGSHHAFQAKGYIPKGTRLAERFINAPDFSFDFIVTKINGSFSGLNDEYVPIAIKSIMDALVKDGYYQKQTSRTERQEEKEKNREEIENFNDAIGDVVDDVVDTIGDLSGDILEEFGFG